MTKLNHALEIIKSEVLALNVMAQRMGKSFDIAVDIILATRGRIVVVGMGKSGIIGRKIAATMASVGQASFFVHPGEAYHGDLGMIHSDDVLVIISNSGETDEIVRLLPFLHNQKNKVIAFTGKTSSTLARHADVVLDVGVEREACNHNLVPTCSTTCSLVMGDALALAVSSERGFQPEDFARFHPGGNLGRKLLCKVSDVMHKQTLPICSLNASFRMVVEVITGGRLGLALVMDEGLLMGVVTDGDIRRAFQKNSNCDNLVAKDIMTAEPVQVKPDIRLVDAEMLMVQRKINSLIVVKDGCVLGVVQIYNQF